jgi:hypothetical protein
MKRRVDIVLPDVPPKRRLTQYLHGATFQKTFSSYYFLFFFSRHFCFTSPSQNEARTCFRCLEYFYKYCVQQTRNLSEQISPYATTKLYKF